jgi:membrane protease YdiL (CAAX protease family)
MRKGLAPLLIFLGFSVVCSWTVWLWPFDNPGSFHVRVFGLQFDAPFNLTKLMVGICLPGLLAITSAAFEGKAHILGIVTTIVKWRTAPKWYLLALSLPVGIFWLSFATVLFYFPSSHHRPSPSWFFLNLLLLLPFGPLWEEIAWRAYALRKLQGHFSAITSALVIGAFWAVWHIPLWWINLGLKNVPTATVSAVLLSGVVTVTAWSVVFAFLYGRSSYSLPVVALLHASYDSAAAVIFPSIESGQLHYIVLSAIFSVVLAIPFAMRMDNDSRTRSW